MSQTLLSLVSTSGGLLADPVSVELASIDGSFGVRRTDDGSVVVASGTLMENSQTGLWTYEFTDPASDISYECSIKVTTAGDELYFTFYRYVANEVFADSSLSDSISASASQSDSAQEAGHSITLVRTALTKEPSAEQDLFRIQLTTEDSVNMPLDVFTYMKGGEDPRQGRDQLEYFYYVATPFDAAVYPVDSPDDKQYPGWYRKNTVEFLAPSTQLAEAFEDDIKQELANLVAAYNRLDVFEAVSEVVISGNGSVEDFVAPVAEFCSEYTFSAGEQLSRVQSQVNNF